MTNASQFKTKTFSLLVLALTFTLGACASGFESGDIGQDQSLASTRGHFDLWQSESGEYYFHLEAGNYEILLQSEGYQTRMSALNGILSVLSNGALEQRYDLFTGADGQFYLNLKARNGEVIGFSEGYTTRSSAKDAIAANVRAVTTYLDYWHANTGARYQLIVGADGQHYFNLHAQNGEIVLSSEGYRSQAAALNGAFAVAQSGMSAEQYDLFEAANGEYYFVLRAGNNEVVGVSELYTTRDSAERAIEAVMALVEEVQLL